MSRSAKAEFSVTKWDEHPYIEEEDGTKFTRVTVEKYFTGDMDGTSELEYTMYYRPDGTAFFVGTERQRWVGGRHGFSDG